MMTEPTPTTELESIELPKNIPKVTEKMDDDEDVDELINELSPPPKPQETTTETKAPTEEDPLNKVKTSSSRFFTSLGLLTKDIDSKLGISTTAQKIDEKIHVTERTKQAIGVVTATASSIDEKFHVSEKTRSTASAVGSSATAQGVRSRVGGVLDGAGKNFKSFDEKHQITSKTANLVSSTADFLTQKINPKGIEKPDVSVLDNSNQKENFPSSFQKD